MSRLELLHPANHAVTHPLQQYVYPLTAQEFFESDKDRSLPRPVALAWEKPSPNGKPFYYELELSLTPDLRQPKRFQNLHDTRAEIWNLYLGTRYYWRVTAREADGELAARSPVWSFVTHSAAPRWIRVPGVTNFRDIGGWRLKTGGTIRQGLLYRSSELNGHLFLTSEGERVLLEDLNIKTDIDLRGSEEIREPALDEWRVRWVNIPLQPYDNIIIPYYQELYRYAFKLLADPATYPAVVHCWGGADRTGTLIFLLEALLGMEENDLFTDYELTSLSIWGLRSTKSVEFTHLLNALKSYAKPGSSIHEQVENYLLEIGVARDEMTSIRTIFTHHPD